MRALHILWTGREVNVVFELSLLTALLFSVGQSRAWIASDPALGFMIFLICGTAVKLMIAPI